MSNSIADNVRKILGQMLRFEPMTVLELSDDPGRVTLDDGGGNPINDVPCLASYNDRQAGDQVQVLKIGPSWLVLGANAKAPKPQLDEDDVKDWINQAIPDVPPTVTVTKGSGAPSGSGWVQATSLPYWRDDGNGNRSIYFPTGSTDSGSAAPPPPSRKPKHVQITPNSHGSWRGNGQSSNNILQGNSAAWGGLSSNWTGAIFYGSKIRDACAGRSVNYIEMSVSRAAGPGWNRKIGIHVGCHGAQNKTKITQLSNVYVATKLAWNGHATFRLSSTITNKLASGDADGLGIKYSGSADYAQLTGGSGTLDIYFND